MIDLPRRTYYCSASQSGVFPPNGKGDNYEPIYAAIRVIQSTWYALLRVGLESARRKASPSIDGIQRISPLVICLDQLMDLQFAESYQKVKVTQEEGTSDRMNHLGKANRVVDLETFKNDSHGEQSRNGVDRCHLHMAYSLP